jgi:hypothetical protein
MGSKKFTLDLTDFWGLAKNTLIVGGAATLTYVAQNLAQLDLGSMGALIVPVVAVSLDTVIKWLKNNQKDEVKE